MERRRIKHKTSLEERLATRPSACESKPRPCLPVPSAIYPPRQPKRDGRESQRVANISRSCVAQMNEYRAELVGKNGHIANSRAFVCANDDHAIVWAKQLG
jgi:hypothetical protein